MRVLLVQPPFWAVNSPSIGLSYLRSALQAVGQDADILYSNLDYAALINPEAYSTVQAQLPVDLLFGDLVFGPALRESPVPTEQVASMMDGILAKQSITRSIPREILGEYTSLAEAAIRFVNAFRADRPWQGYDLVGFTTTFSLVPALAMARAIKASGDAPPIVFGGCHCDGSLGVAIMKHFPWVDFAARGDGEKLIVSLLEHLRTGEIPLPSIDGLLWREGGRIAEARVARARMEDMNALPDPSFTDWFKQLDRLGSTDRQTLRLPLETSRGCWYGQKNHCTFCGLNGTSMEFRSKGADKILNEYRTLMEHEPPVIYAVDSVLDPKFFQDVIPRIAALPKKALMFFEVRATHSRAQLMALRSAEIRVLQPGIESLNTRLLKLMNKGTTAFQNTRLLRWTAEFSMPVSWNLLCGLPGEEPGDYNAMAALVPSLVHLLPPVAECNLIHVDRFSPLFDRHQAEIRPIAPYALALGLEPAAARELAYHFEFDDSVLVDPEVSNAIDRLSAEVLKWQAVLGKAVFVRMEREGKCWLYDTRPGAVLGEACLEGVRHKAYLMMDDGATLDALTSELGPIAEELLQEFQAHRWVAELDGKYLSLAVPVDEDVPEAIPADLQGSVATVLYQHRMTQLWKAVKDV